MQNLNVNSLYYVKHPMGNWEGEVTFLESLNDGFIVKPKTLLSAKHRHTEGWFNSLRGERLKLGKANWSWKELNVDLENK